MLEKVLDGVEAGIGNPRAIKKRPERLGRSVLEPLLDQLGQGLGMGETLGLVAKRGSAARPGWPMTRSQKFCHSRSFWMPKKMVPPSPTRNGP